MKTLLYSALCILMLIRCNQESPVVSIAPTRMNVLYIGVDNPLKIAVSNTDLKDIEVSIDTGKIIGKNGQYYAQVIKPGNFLITVKVKGKIVKQERFRSKVIPDPRAFVARQRGGDIIKEKLYGARLETWYTNDYLGGFDFEMPECKVVHFRISAPVKNNVVELHVNGDEINGDAIEFIKKLQPGQKIFFDEIDSRFNGDMITRRLGPVVLNIR